MSDEPKNIYDAIVMLAKNLHAAAQPGYERLNILAVHTWAERASAAYEEAKAEEARKRNLGG